MLVKFWREILIIILIVACVTMGYFAFNGNADVKALNEKYELLEAKKDSIDQVNLMILEENVLLSESIKYKEREVLVLKDNYNAIQTEMITILNEINEMKYEGKNYTAIDNYNFFKRLFSNRLIERPSR